MSEKEISSVKNKKYEFVAPDGGWGYMIFLAFIINVSTTMSFVGCFGMLFNDFMEEIGLGSAGFTLVIGITAICFAVSGFLANPLLKLMSKRKLALLASITFNSGCLGVAFVNSKALFFLFQGVMQGTGVGILYNLSNTIINEYFDKKRLFAVSFVQTIVAINIMITPMFIRWSLEEYGYRGTLIIITAIAMHNLIGVALMQPVEWHMKRVEVPVEITQEMRPLLLEKNMKTDESNNIPIVRLTDLEAVVSVSVENESDTALQNEKKTGFRKILEAFVDVSLCKSFLLSCVCIGPSICMFADNIFTLILPQALYSMGWNQDMVALALSLIGFGDLTMRFLLIFASKWLLKIGSQEVYIMGLVVAFISRLGLILSDNVIAIYVFIVLMGVARCNIGVLVVIVISEAVSTDKFTMAIGMFMMLLGIIVLIVGPVIGAIRDATNSFTIAFYILTSLFAIVVILWTIEIFYKKNNLKKKTTKRQFGNIK